MKNGTLSKNDKAMLNHMRKYQPEKYKEYARNLEQDRAKQQRQGYIFILDH